MVTTHVGRVESVVDKLLQLAQFVESSGITPAEVGARLKLQIAAGGGTGEREARDLLKLCDSNASSEDFARGLRRQAEEIRAKSVA